jgi:malate dehydrogenase
VWAGRLFGVTTLDITRARTFVAGLKKLDVKKLQVPVVGGHAGTTILPLLSQNNLGATFTQEELEALTKRIQFGGDEVVEAKAGAGSATLSMAYAGAEFTYSVLRALNGATDVVECTFVQSTVTDAPFFASKVHLGVRIGHPLPSHPAHTHTIVATFIHTHTERQRAHLECACVG